METTYSTTKQLLIGTEIPKETRTYKPISHEQLIDLTLNSIQGAGFTLDKELYSSAREGQVANGKFSIRNVMDKEMSLQIAWQNSYDKSLSLKFAIGAHVFICKNGMVFGDMGSFKKKHQGEIQEFTPTAISEYIKRAGDLFSQVQKEREQMKNVELSKRVKAELVGRMLIEEEFITSTQLNIINRQFKNPEFNYGCPNTMWELYQFTTQSMKDIHPSLWMENHMRAHQFFVNESGIIVPKAEIDIPVLGSHPQLEIFTDIIEENAVGEV
jgi:hypothetical protein